MKGIKAGEVMSVAERVKRLVVKLGIDTHLVLKNLASS
jgi:hypothetical protein